MLESHRTPSRRLGWLGPAIVALGVAVAALGTYAVISGRPEPGDLLDRIEIDPERAIIVRTERAGERHFVELVEHSAGVDVLVWRALVPPYAGRPGAPGIAWGKNTITVRVIRGGRAEIFGLALDNAAKLGGFKLAPGKGPVVKQTSGPVTLTDHDRSYELVEGVGWHQLVAIDLATGEAVWKHDLAATAVDAAGIDDGTIWVRQAGVQRGFEVRTGSEKIERSSKSS